MNERNPHCLYRVIRTDTSWQVKSVQSQLRRRFLLPRREYTFHQPYRLLRIQAKAPTFSTNVLNKLPKRKTHTVTLCDSLICMGKALGRTFGGDVLVSSLRASDHLLAALFERVIGRLKLLQVDSHGFVLGDLLADLLHLHGDGGRLAETLCDALQGLQHGVDLVMELRGYTRTTRHKLAKGKIQDSECIFIL